MAALTPDRLDVFERSGMHTDRAEWPELFRLARRGLALEEAERKHPLLTALATRDNEEAKPCRI